MTMTISFRITFALCCSLLEAQDHLWQRVLKLPETDQVQFVKSYIDEDLGKPYSGRFNERSDATATLMRTKGEAFIPLFEGAIQAAMKAEAPLANGVVSQAVGMISNAGTDKVLETVVRLFADDNVRLKRFLPMAMSSGWNQGKLQPLITRWYHALESPNPDVREAAAIIVQDVFARDVVMAYDHQALADAMTTRNGHPPTLADFEHDPLIAAIEGKSMTFAYNTRRQVLELSARMRRKKE